MEKYYILCAGINYWLKAQVLSQIPVGERASFWMGESAIFFIFLFVTSFLSSF